MEYTCFDLEILIRSAKKRALTALTFGTSFSTQNALRLSKNSCLFMIIIFNL